MNNTSLDIKHLRSWVGRSESTQDVASLVPLRALGATLDRGDFTVAAGTEVPPCWHWLYFLPLHPQSEIGPDGHARRGGFLPPVPLARRMWAGSRIAFVRPLCAGQTMERVSRIADVGMKQGRSGALVFVKVEHKISVAGQLTIHEEHDIVYRDMPDATTAQRPNAPHHPTMPNEASSSGAPALMNAQWSREICADDVLLFRYSALTFNGHRIHYDRRYVTEVEGYPGLIVHGPLIATLLLDLLRRELPQAVVRHFSFKALQPIFDVAPFSVCGRVGSGNTVKLWAVTPTGQMAMDASAELA